MKTDLRYEKKMVFDALRLGQVRSWIQSHPDAFRVAYPPRQVNNIYFDTPDYGMRQDHQDGIGDRSKFRFRWYGESWQVEGGQLEIKRKIGRLGYKHIQPIGGPLDLSRLNWREVIRTLKAESEERFAFLLGHVSPALINQYHREYYESTDRVIRITLDYDMRAYPQKFGFSPNLRFPTPLIDEVVIEIKAPMDEGQRIADVVSAFPLRCLQNSKYLTAMEYGI